MAELLAIIKQRGRRPEMAAAAGLALALLMVVRPLPGPVLDVLLAASLAVSLVVLLMALFGERPTDLAAMPELLVLSSLGRVALCLGVARAILAAGDAGSLVRVTGEQLTGGGAALVSGVAVLVIMTLGSFLVVTVGVMRLAEVSARFALDALPGRQMAIDAALAAGRASAEEGREQTRRLDAESGFCGAMDGVARFLRGESMATLAIVGITPLAAAANAGGSGLSEWGQTYLPLAVGHGTTILVPGALMGAAAAVTLARSGRIGLLQSRELLGQPSLLLGAAGVLLTLGLIPAASSWPLLAMGALALAAAWASHRRHTTTARSSEAERAPMALQVGLGLGLIGMVANQDLVAELGRAVTGLADELGFALPPLTVSDRASLQRNEYVIELGPEELARGELRPGQQLAVPTAEGALPSGGTEAVLPDGRAAAWVGPDEAERSAARGDQVLRPAEVLTLHLESCLRARADQLFGLQQAADVLSALAITHPATVAALEAAGAGPALLRDVGWVLLADGVPLSDRVSLAEAIPAALGRHRSAEAVAEAVRPTLRRSITRLAAPYGRAEVIGLDPGLEDELGEACDAAGEGPVTLHPDRAQTWHRALRALGQEYAPPGRRAVLYCSRRSRRAASQLVRESGARVLAVCGEELDPLTVIETVYLLTPAGLWEPGVLAATRE